MAAAAKATPKAPERRDDEKRTQQMIEEYQPPAAPLSSARRVRGLPEPHRPLRALVGAPEQLLGRLLARAMTRIVDSRERALARKDPAWASLRTRLNAPGVDGLLQGEDDIAKYHAVFQQTHVGWPFELERWLHANSLLRLYDRLAVMVQRGSRGWADEDLWGLDSYLTGVVAGAARQIAELSFGWDDRLWATHDDWIAELRRLADKLDQLHAHLDQHGGLNDAGAEALCDDVFATLCKAYGHLRVD